MLKASLFFVAIALIALLLADLEISTLHPWTELSRMAWGAVTPDVPSLWNLKLALLNTVVFAFLWYFSCSRSWHRTGFRPSVLPLLGCSALLSAPSMRFSGRSSSSLLLDLTQPAVYSLSQFLMLVSLRRCTQRLSKSRIGVHWKAFPRASGGLSRFFYGILPVIYADTKHYTGYRFECALRSSAILGFIGLPTLGFHLETAFREGIYSEAWALLYAFYILIASLKILAQATPCSTLHVVASFVLLSRTITVSWDNIVRFFTYDLLPWPMRREGVLDGTHEISFAWEPIVSWT